MKYLTKIDLDLDKVFYLKLNDNYCWHQRLWDFFPFNQNQKRDFLTRIDFKEDSVCVWILSHRETICPKWCPTTSFLSNKISPSFLNYKHYRFDLKVNPTKSLLQLDESGNRKLNKNGKPIQSKRVPLIKQNDLKDWIDRKASCGGFVINESKQLEIGPVITTYSKKGEQFLNHGGVIFRGIITITNSELFKQTYSQGIGRAKGFGFGLPLIAPVLL